MLQWGPKSQNLTPCSHCCLTRQPLCFACALQPPTFCLHCSLIHRQASRWQRWNSKTLCHNCIKVPLQFRSPYYTNLRQYCKRPKRGGAHDNAQIPNLQLSLPTSAPESCVGLQHFAAGCCNSHVQEDMFSSNHFTSIESKTISWLSELRVPLQNFRVSF